MSVLAIIPARGGSKGIPRKNVRRLAGKPLVAWTIEAAQAAPLVDRVIVSTDDEEIANVARQGRAGVVKRPPELAGDTASSESALLHALQTLNRNEGYRPEIIAFLQCTSPLTTPDDIAGTVALVAEDGYDSAVTVTPFHHFIWREEKEGRLAGVNHDGTQRLMRQQRPGEYLEVGAVYAMDVEGFEREQFRFFGRIGRYVLPKTRALEIDDMEDWVLAEALMRQQKRPSIPVERLKQIRAVITDFDGVLTDNRVHVNEHGIESVVCNRGDGWGIELLRKAGYLVACISTETNDVVQARCEKLHIPYWYGQKDKLTVLQTLLQENGLGPEAALYIGNDTNDTHCLEYVGLAVAPADAAQEAAELAAWQTQARGGEGVLREVARQLLRHK